MARLTGATVVATGTIQLCDIDYDNLAATCTEGPIEGKAIAFYPTLEAKELGQNLSVSKILDKLTNQPPPQPLIEKVTKN